MAVNFPNSPITNQTYTVGNRTWQWTGVYWKAISTTVGYTGSKGESSYTTSPTPPANPVVGDRWFNTNYGIELVWTNDGDSTQWVEIAASGYIGLQGYAGSQGVIGYTGSQGPPTGYTGSTGFTGSRGDTGYVGSNPMIKLSSTIPTNVSPGTLWYKADDGTLNIYYGDLDSYQWVEISAIGQTGYTGSQGPAGGYTGSVGYTGSLGYTGSIGYTGSAPTVETVYALPYTATIAPNANNGPIQTITLTGNVTFNAFTSPITGQTITLLISQDSAGGRILSSTMLFAGGSKTLSTTPNAIDLLSATYINGTYYASLVKGFN